MFGSTEMLLFETEYLDRHRFIRPDPDASTHCEAITGDALCDFRCFRLSHQEIGRAARLVIHIRPPQNHDAVQDVQQFNLGNIAVPAEFRALLTQEVFPQCPPSVALRIFSSGPSDR